MDTKLANSAPQGVLSNVWGPDFRASYIILAATLAAHGLWLLNDVLPHEEWLQYHYVKEQKLAIMWEWCVWFVCPGHIVPNAIISVFPDVLLAARGVSLFLHWGCAFLTYLIGSRYMGLGRLESLFVALVSLSYPGNMMAHLIITLWYPFYLFGFLIATVLALQAESWSGRSHWLARVGALLLFFSSFSVGSLLVFYGGFLALHLIYYRGRGPFASWFGAMGDYFRRRADYLLLPLAFWFGKKLVCYFLPTNYLYNRPHIKFSYLMDHYAIYFETMWRQAQFLVEPIALFVGAGVLCVLLICWWRRAIESEEFVWKANLGRIGYAVLLFVCASFPYVAVGKPPHTTEDFDTRHLLLIGLPIAIVLVTVVSLVTKLLFLDRKWAYAFILAVIASSSWIRCHHCVRYQVYGIRDASLAAKLRQCEQAEEIHLWRVTSHVHGYGPDFKLEYVWPFFLREVLGGDVTNRYCLSEPRDETWYVKGVPHKLLSEERFAKELVDNWFPQGWMHDYKFPPAGAAQGSIVVERGSLKGNWRLATRYWYHKYIDRDGLPDFLNRATTITIVTTGGRPGATQVQASSGVQSAD